MYDAMLFFSLLLFLFCGSLSCKSRELLRVFFFVSYAQEVCYAHNIKH